MKKETLERANRLANNIRDIREAISANGIGCHYTMAFHHGRDALRIPLPGYLRPKIDALLDVELKKLECEFEALTDDNADAQDGFVPTGQHNTETEEAGDEEIQLPKKGKDPSVFFKLFWSFMMTLIGFGIIFCFSICICAAFGDEFDIQFATFNVAFGTCWFLAYCVLGE